MSFIKTIAVYLPQFHRVKENDEWWGEGFTEWTTVKQAEPLFEGHDQPRIPYQGDYYNLLERETFERQAFLMHRYGVFGFGFYHYYFKNGKKILEQPAENLLRWTDINIPFCFIWASEPWIRTWSKFAGNAWVEKENLNVERKGNGMLLEQDYGTHKEWREHFNYLLPFFKDERYIKKDGKPLFIFYNANQILCLGEMIRCWNQLAIENGLGGIYALGAHLETDVKELAAELLYEPDEGLHTLDRERMVQVRQGVRCYDYADLTREVVQGRSHTGRAAYYMGVTGFDTTPRRGRNGVCVCQATPQLFEVMMEGLFKKCIEENREFLFIDAWNEWGESMYLEPDSKYGFAYLEVLLKLSQKYDTVKVEDRGGADELVNVCDDERWNRLNYYAHKNKILYETAINLMFLIQEREYVFKKYFQDKKINSVAIYGLGKLGKALLFQFEKEQISIKYTIDKYVGAIKKEIPMYRPEEQLPYVDIMIITSYEFESINNYLMDKGVKNIVSLHELLDNVAEYSQMIVVEE